MMLAVQKRLAGKVLKCSPKRITLDDERLEEIKGAITKADIRVLISQGAIKRTAAQGVSRARARFRQGQKRKGRRHGPGGRKGSIGARKSKKAEWTRRVRLQRNFLGELKAKNLIANKAFKELYRKIKGGFFRSKNHLIIYMKERGLMQ